MAPAKKLSGKDSYSVILPTFNERQNLPIITWLLNRTFTEKYVPIAFYSLVSRTTGQFTSSATREKRQVLTWNSSQKQQPRLGTRHRRRRLTRRHARRSAPTRKSLRPARTTPIAFRQTRPRHRLRPRPQVCARQPHHHHGCRLQPPPQVHPAHDCPAEAARLRHCDRYTLCW